MMFKRVIRINEYDGNEETNKKVFVICNGKVKNERIKIECVIFVAGAWNSERG
jgi:hypothetical protein